jgi:hypothetical protein
MLYVAVNSNMLLLLETLMPLLIAINLSAHKENIQLFATIDFSKIQNFAKIIYWKDYFVDTVQEGSSL